MSETTMQVKVPEAVIQAHVAAAVGEILARDPEALVQRCVAAAMCAKENSYDRETIFEKTIAKMIRDMAREVFAKWLEDKRDAIREAIEMRLKRSPQKFVRELADKAVSAMASSYRFDVKIEMGNG